MIKKRFVEIVRTANKNKVAERARPWQLRDRGSQRGLAARGCKLSDIDVSVGGGSSSRATGLVLALCLIGGVCSPSRHPLLHGPEAAARTFGVPGRPAGYELHYIVGLRQHLARRARRGICSAARVAGLGSVVRARRRCVLRRRADRCKSPAGWRRSRSTSAAALLASAWPPALAAGVKKAATWPVHAFAMTQPVRRICRVLAPTAIGQDARQRRIPRL